MNLFRSTKKLFAAIEAGDLETVRAYVEADSRKWLNAADSAGNTPLHRAAAKGHLQMLHFLQERGASQWHRNHDGEFPLHAAMQSGKMEAVKSLLGDGSYINSGASGRTGISPLQAAISGGHAEILGLFLQTGKADLVNGQPPAMYCAVQHRKPEMVRVLLAAGADPNVTKKTEPDYYDDDFLGGFYSRRSKGKRAPEEETPLSLAARYNETEIARDLLVAGAKPLKSEYPLHSAATHANVEMATLLISHGVNVNVLNETGQTALHAAATKGHVEVVRFLLAQGIDKDVKDHQGRTALSYAQQFAHTEMVDALGAPVSIAPVAIKPVPKPAPAAPRKEPSPEPVRKQDDLAQDTEAWTRAGQNSVVHTSTFSAMGRKLTEIFNFESRERVTITENLKLGTETMAPHESFDGVSEDALARALREFRRLGGKANDDDVFRGRLLKSKLKPGGLNG